MDMGIIKRHPILFALLGFFFVTLPSAVEAYWSLAEKVRGVEMPNLSITWLNWFLPIVGFLLLLFVIFQGRRKGDQVGNDSPKPLRKKPSQEQVAERLTFIKQSQAVSERLFKNSQGAENRSICSIVRDMSVEAPIREYIAEDGLASQTVRLLIREFDDLFRRTSNHHKYTEELSVSSLDDTAIRSVCNTTRELVIDYRRLVDETMQVLKNMGERGVANLWDEAPWASRIHRGLADNYDELMRLVTDLKGTTPKGYKDILPNDDQLSKFPRASLLS
ncbi:hypothetical protein ACFLW6_01355 [Chloroflexota bacterium]